MKKLAFVLSAGLALTLSSVAQAKVTPEQAAKLENELTPIGAERAGNAAGTIPSWDGGITRVPSNYTKGAHHPDPYSEDKILFTIDSSNFKQYLSTLTNGQLAMFKKYPTYKINVYPTRRTASYPEKIYDFSKRNAVQAELTQDGAGLLNAKVGVPFPIPQSGLEVVWNHLTRYRGESAKGEYVQIAPQKDGSFVPYKYQQESLQFYVQEQPEKDEFLFLYKQRITAPSRKSGEVLLVHETMNQVSDPRRAWRYDPGRRRSMRVPTVAYDAVANGSDGLSTVDNFDMFSGSPDKYNWKIIGKKEMYVPYNSYQLHSKDLAYEDIIQAGHLNQDHTRYELHRVWMVEAELKTGQSNIYKKRVFYFDEDSWQALLVDHYNEDGELWRVAEAHVINYYEVPVLWSTVTTIYDLKAGRYVAHGLNNQEEMFTFNNKMTYRQFTSSALRREGR